MTTSHQHPNLIRKVDPKIPILPSTLTHYTSIPCTSLHGDFKISCPFYFLLATPPFKPFISFSFPAQISFCYTKFMNFNLTGISLLSNNPFMCLLVPCFFHFPVWLFSSSTLLSLQPCSTKYLISV